ncbi:UDP-glucuronic acid decarboxylase 1-like [Oncorhynchus keta]|uniref:UDP-glucuronic acid decarboxylase 1-like n=1 Tax=Oncorhynchus keta TaxID=8018 RepID=UPI00227B26B2|nr:UDP-glucuronic acid decarboxylase 1-like [Oncorhynchus keta]
MMKRIIWVISGLNRRMMKLLVALALIAYIASVWGTYTNMRSIQEHGEMKIEERIDEAVAPLREKIRDLELRYVCFITHTCKQTHTHTNKRKQTHTHTNKRKQTHTHTNKRK